jgi:cell division protein ftsX
MKKPSRRISIDRSRLIAILSVAMVLMILGITMLIGLAVRNASADIRSGVTLVVVVNPQQAPASADSLRKTLAAAPYAEKVTLRSADEVLKSWEQMMGREEMLDINPFLPEYEIVIRGRWANADSLDAIAGKLSAIKCVDHVQAPTEVVAGVNHTMGATLLVLCITGLILLIISIVLITNTVRLQLYASRIVIHTQQYVGATRGYIVRPYIKSAALTGLLAALTAVAGMLALTAYLMSVDPIVASLVTWPDQLLTAGVLCVIGVGLCTLTAAVVAYSILGRSFDEIYD